MIEFLLASTLSVSQVQLIKQQETVNKFCAYLVGIPYQSDNFSNSEWERFNDCVDIFTEPKQ
jgi:hypothetical protein